MNLMAQAECNLELKWGRYGWMKQGCTKCMAAQWHQFWSLGIQESNALNRSQFGVETREIWPIKAMLRKEHIVMGLHTGPILFSCPSWILGFLLLGSFLWQLGLLGFHFSLTLFLVARLFLIIWSLSKFKLPNIQEGI